MERHYISRAGLEKLMSELDHWRNVKRPAMVRQLATARTQGDLAENAEYLSAREELTRIDQKIYQLEQTIRAAVLVDETNVNTDQVRVFTRVRVFDHQKNQEREFSLVSPTEADPAAGLISHQSPVGKGLLGRKVGEKVDIEIPSGIVTWTILEILPFRPRENEQWNDASSA